MKTKKCVYCGNDASAKDHIVPLSYYYSGKRKGRMLTSEYGKENLVDCCRECNSIASNKVFIDFEEKKNYIQERLKIKYKKIINTPFWSHDEINEMGYSLKKDIIIQQLARKWILNRINYPVEMYSEIELKNELVKFINKQL